MSTGAQLQVVREGYGTALYGIAPGTLIAPLERIAKVAQWKSSILLRGETGTGKTLLARAIHEYSGRDGSYVDIDCSAVPETLIESTLFGQVRGAFTGAVSRKGYIEEADDGTLLIDEVGNIPLDVQSKLLNVHDTKAIRRVGSSSLIPVDVRFIYATNMDLEHMIGRGEFRQDLHYRINVVEINIAPLRDRIQEIPSIARYVLKHDISDEIGSDAPHLHNDAMGPLVTYGWPGNVRELRRVLLNAVINSGGEMIYAKHIDLGDDRVRPADAGEQEVNSGLLKKTQSATEQDAIIAALQASDGNRRVAAEVLGISPRTLRYKLAKMRENDSLPPEFWRR